MDAVREEMHIKKDRGCKPRLQVHLLGWGE